MAPKVPRIARSQFAETYASAPWSADWRVLSRVLVATFRAPSFAAAVAFVARVASASDELDHHPDIDLRYPGRLRIAVSTHASYGLTRLDAELAGRISALAAQDGLVAELDRTTRAELAIDALDISLVLPFWRAVLGYIDEPGADPVDAVVDPLRMGPAVWFQQMDEPRPQRSRMHLDVLVPHDAAEARVAAAIAAGGRLLDDSHARSFWVLADPEGNEACVCTWQDRE